TLERWLRFKYKHGGKFTEDQVRSVAEAEFDSEMEPARETMDADFLMGFLDGADDDLIRGGEEELAPTLAHELQRLFPNIYPDAYKRLKEKYSK
ncbi:MAG: hypothetical protein ACREDR_41170, partial [Blastocatellia bacterium]